MEPGTDIQRRRFLTWLWRLPVVAALAGGAYGAWRAVRVHFGKEEPRVEPTFTTFEPVKVAELQAFPQEWSLVNFTADDLPAIAIRLPKRIPASLAIKGHYYAAFSRVCTHQACIVNLNTSPEAVALASNYRPQNPALVCPCHLSVFLPLESGKAVSGPATRPLPRVRLTLQDQTLYAVGLENES